MSRYRLSRVTLCEWFHYALPRLKNPGVASTGAF